MAFGECTLGSSMYLAECSYLVLILWGQKLKSYPIYSVEIGGFRASGLGSRCKEVPKQRVFGITHP